MERFLILDISSQGIKVKKSTKPHPDSDLDLFVTRIVRRGYSVLLCISGL